jgi:hypothetical protein
MAWVTTLPFPTREGELEGLVPKSYPRNPYQAGKGGGGLVAGFFILN